jgi:hypothetical protein
VHAGIPGIGLGGLFFVISALAMLAVEVVLTLRGKSSLERWRLVLRQSGIAAGIVLATVGMLWLLELLVLGALLDPAGGSAGARIGATAGAGGVAPNALEVLPISAAPILGTLVLLCLVLCFSEALRWVVRRPSSTTRKKSS